MAEPNRPRGRQRNITGSGSVGRRGDGLGTGPVGAGRGGPSARGGPSGAYNVSGAPQRGSRGRGGLIKLVPLIIIMAVAIVGGSLLFGGGGTQTPPSAQPAAQGSGVQSGLGSLLGGFSGGVSSTSSGWDRGDNTGKLNASVASGARDKRTKVLGGGRDTFTIMVYMCGTDLESRNGMATADLQEMLDAELGDKVNVLVYTGGCKAWKNSAVSSSVNQIYKVENEGLRRLVEDAGASSMTSPANLSSFIKYCRENYPANREMLIFWDHGGGSVSGYGYDEKNPRSGSMTLAGIDEALKNAGGSFDAIGFDACLMATVETALMLDPYADYLIASEETEPGVGWYYTNWLTALSKNTSMPTVELGKAIADDFVDVCAEKCWGQKTTLSVTDLAEAAATVPTALNAFASDTTKLIKAGEFQTASTARSGAREFAQSSKIDQVDLTHLAFNLGTDAGKKLADALLGAVKYNRTSSNMTNAYGLSAFFPLRKVSSVDSAVKTYEAIGMDGEYTDCIRAFASMETGGQAAAGGTAAASPLGALLGSVGSLGGSGGASGGADAISQLLGALMSGGGQGGIDLSSLTGGASAFFTGKALDTEEMASYIAENRLDPANLVWTDGKIQMSQQQWDLVQDIALNVFYDDGAGYIDLGLDNILSFDEGGSLLGTYDGAWLAIDGQIVPYYYDNTVDDGTHYTITGHVPALLNGERVNLLLVFDDENPKGYVAGAVSDYRDGETQTVAKAAIGLEDGDTLDFICDYYSYDGEYQDSYFLGEQLTVSGEPVVSDLMIDVGSYTAAYRFTDLYQQHYWTEIIP